MVAAIRSADDLERMGVLARHVADAALRRPPVSTLPAEVRPTFVEMGRIGVDLALKTAEVVRSRNVVLSVFHAESIARKSACVSGFETSSTPCLR